MRPLFFFAFSSGILNLKNQQSRIWNISVRTSLRVLMMLFFLLPLVWIPPLWAESLLIREPMPENLSQVHLKFLDREIIPEIRPVRLPGHFAILLLADTIGPEQWNPFLTRLTAMVQTAPSSADFDLVLISGGQARVWENLRSPAQLRLLLQEVPPQSAHPTEWGGFLQVLGTLPAGRQEWSPLFLMMAPPAFSRTELLDYAARSLSLRLRRNKVRFCPFRLGEQDRTFEVFREALRATGGLEISAAMDAESIWRALKDSTAYEVSFAEPQLKEGFLDGPMSLITGSASQSVLADFKLLFTTQSKEIVSVTRYAELLETFERAKKALEGRDSETLHRSLEGAFAINPIFPPLLRLAGNVYKQQQDFETALQMFSRLEFSNPLDPVLFAELADLHFKLEHWEDCERYCLKALSLQPNQVALYEKMGLTKKSQGDSEKAIGYFRRVVELDPAKSGNWAVLGDLLEKNRQIRDAQAAYWKAIQLDPARDEIRLRLLELHLSRQQKEEAKEVLTTALAAKAAGEKFLLQYAQVAETLQLSEVALEFYSLARAKIPGNEKVMAGEVRLLKQAGQIEKALSLLQPALLQSPQSAILHVLKIQMLAELNREEPLRAAISSAEQAVAHDVDVLTYSAVIHDQDGNHAAEIYGRLAKALEETGENNAGVQRILERGILCGFRDGESSEVEPLLNKLRQTGGHLFAGSSTKSTEERKAETVVPGGIQGAALASDISGRVAHENFIFRFCERLVRQTQGKEGKAVDLYLRPIREYLEIITGLKSLGVSEGRETKFRLDISSKKGREQAEKVLEWLGWEIKKKGNRTIVELSNDPDHSRRQRYGAALGIDELSMRGSLESGTPFQFSVRDELVPLVAEPGKFFGNGRSQSSTANLIPALLEDFPAARVYVAIAGMEKEAARGLLQAVPPDQIREKYADILILYGSAIVIDKGELRLPGGKESGPAWEKLAQVSPAKPLLFLSSLLSRDEGKLLAYYFNLARLTPARQRYFTSSASRLARFYEVFSFPEKEYLKKHIHRRLSDPFTLLGPSLPVTPDGKVKFPGSLNVWRVARGFSADPAEILKLAGKGSRLDPSKSEEDVLIELMSRTYEVDGQEISQVENFLAVARINEHRKVPLDEEGALFLSQNYAKYRGFYPYLAALPTLNSSDLQLLLEACRQVERHDKDWLNSALGSFESLIHLAVLLNENQVLTEDEAAEFVRNLSKSVTPALEEDAFSQACLNTLQFLLQRCRSIETGDPGLDPLIRALSGNAITREYSYEGQIYPVNRKTWKSQRMGEILKLQKITPMGIWWDWQRINAALATERKGLAARVDELEQVAKRFVEFSPEELKAMDPALRETLTWGNREKLMEIIGKLKKDISSKKKPTALNKAIEGRMRELYRHVHPFLMISLLGYVYAYHFSPADLILAENPALVRSHLFCPPILSSGKLDCWSETQLADSSARTGRHLQGNLAQIAKVAGEAGVQQREAGASGGDFNARALIASQLGSLRSVPWASLNDEGLRLVAFQIRYGRELIVQAGFHADLIPIILEFTQGLLGPKRQLALSRALSDHDIPTALGFLSASDCLLLARAALESPLTPKYSSPLREGLEKRMGDASLLKQVSLWGGTHPNIYGCTHSHLLPLNPYEDYEFFLFAGPMAERLSDVLLNLAEAASRCGMPVDGLSVLAEPAVHQLASRIKMNTKDDWIHAVQRMNEFRMDPLIPLLEGLK
jgi:tetratricopeptide (TPR) repeat protein